MGHPAHDQYPVFAGVVEYPVLPVDKAANVAAKLRAERCDQGEIAQPHECRIKPMHVECGYIVAKPRGAEFVDLNQISFGGVGEFNLSHALPGVWR